MVYLVIFMPFRHVITPQTPLSTCAKKDRPLNFLSWVCHRAKQANISLLPSSSPVDDTKPRLSLSSAHTYTMRLDTPAPWSVLTYVTFKHVLQRGQDRHLHPIHSGFLPAQRDAFCQGPGLSHPIHRRKD